VPGHGDGQPQMLVERAARLLDVDVGQQRVVRPAGGDHHMVDRGGQFLEETIESVLIGGVEGHTAQRADFGRGPIEAVGIAAGQNDVGALGAGEPSRLEPDAGAAADHHDCLPGELRFAVGGWDGVRGAHESSRGCCCRGTVGTAVKGRCRTVTAVPTEPGVWVQCAFAWTGWRSAVISLRSDLSALTKISEKVGNGWMTSRSTSSGTRARMASVACCSHSPASGPSASAPVSRWPSLSSVRKPFDSA